MVKVDLHMHSQHSDGKLSCEALLAEVKAKGIGLFALTDHDNIMGVEEMSLVAKRAGINFVPGVEIASTFMGKEFHLTTYGFDLRHDSLLALLAHNMQVRLDFDEVVLEHVAGEYGQHLIAAFQAYKDEPALGGWPSLNFLIKKGIIEDISEYFALTSKIEENMIFPSPQAIIEIVHAAGGRVFLAHPSSNGRGGLAQDVLDYFLESDIDGIECFSPYTKDEKEVQYYLDYCNRHNLMISGGSDYHGGFVGRSLGYPHITGEMISYQWFLDHTI